MPVLVPEALLTGGKGKLFTAVPADECGIHVPVPGTHAVVLLGNVGALSSAVIHTLRTKEQMRWHSLRVVLAEKSNVEPDDVHAA